MNKYLVVAAIDFGTTYSGWAFSFRHEFERDPLQVSSKTWTGGTVTSHKAPTCVLIHPDGETLDSFGYDAQKRFAELVAEECHQDWYFFERFKMLLYENSTITLNISLEDISGNRLEARKVFSLAIKYLKDDLTKIAGKQIGENQIKEDEVLWVLTVPAIWNDAAKQFMRKSAEEAGIDGDRLLLCLEPEAASLLCRYLPVSQSQMQETSSLAELQPGSKYMVLDAGGGTVDITVHEILPDNNLRELHKASGGCWGGTKVDKAFEEFLGEIFGQDVMHSFKKRCIEDWIGIFEEFEVKKRDVSMYNDNKITINVPVILMELTQEMTGKSWKESIEQSRHNISIKITGGKPRIDMAVFRTFFHHPVEEILKHVASLLKEPAVSECSTILMVGGFSESPIFQEMVKERFRESKIVIPASAGLAVLKGAVIYGHRPNVIQERMCRFTYGQNYIHIKSEYCCHPPTREEKGKDKILRCYDLFKVHVKSGQSVKFGEESEECISTPMYDDQTGMSIHIYSSSDLNPNLVTDTGCRNIGKVSIDFPDTSLGKERQIGTRFIYWGTEIKVKVEDKAARVTTTKYVQFLG